MKNRLLAWLLCLAMLLTIGAVAVAETNPNAGLGYYPGTAEKGSIAVECSTMSVMNTRKQGAFAVLTPHKEECFPVTAQSRGGVNKAEQGT